MQGRFWSSLEQCKDTATTIQSIISSIAIVVGGIWILFLFDPFSELQPSLSIAQNVSSTNLSGGIILLDIHVALTDTTKTSARISHMLFEVQRLLPIDQKQREEITQALKNREIASTTLPSILMPVCVPLSGNQRLVVPAGGTTHFDSFIFIPDNMSKKLIEKILIKSWFFPRGSWLKWFSSSDDCDIGKQHWSVTTVHDVTQSAVSSSSQAP
jgi:hypothetical protein